MKNFYSFLLSVKTIFLFCALSLTISLFSQDDDKTESPYLTVFCNDTSNVSFPLISTNVEATISGVIANIELEQVYTNSGDSALDATYVFPMSTNAAIYSMQMIVGDRVIDAEIRKKSDAQAIFDSANANGQTATLLEQHRPNVFQMSLANIKPNDTLKVRLKYTELIEPEMSVYQFVIPSIVGPRFTTNGEEWVKQSVKDSLALSSTELNINLTINAGMSVSAICTSHTTDFLNDGKVASCSLSTHPGKDFIVDYTLCKSNITTGLLLYEGEEENFFLSIIQPPKPEVDFVSPNREYVFVMDISGSMKGEPIEVSKNMITNLLNDLNFNDKFNILFFAGGSSVLADNSLPVTQENINSAVSMIDELNAGGSTYLLPALQRALNMEGTANFSRTFIILTDGYVTVEKEAYELIREHLGDANFFSFGIGRSVNREIIEGIAYVGQGESFVVTENEAASTTAARFKEYIEHPALTNIQASFSNINAYDIEPVSIPDVFAERPIIIYGKYDDASNGSIMLTGDYAGGEISKILYFSDYQANSEENIALKYLWARRRIKLMDDYGIASNENDAMSIEEEITQLGLQYSLITQYTSFVAVDSMAVSDNSAPVENNSYEDGNFASTGLEQFNNGLVNKSPEIIQIIGKNVLNDDLLTVRLKGFEQEEAGNLILTVVGINGSVYKTEQLSGYNLEETISLFIGDLTNGMYLIQLQSGNRIVDSEKFIIMK